jgi:hypothetical protein
LPLDLNDLQRFYVKNKTWGAQQSDVAAHLIA